MSLLTTFIVVLFNRARSSFDFSSGRVEAEAKVRETLLKVSPLLTSGFGAGAEAVYIPTVASAATATLYNNVVFTTTEDFLHNNSSTGVRYDALNPTASMVSISSTYPPSSFSGNFNFFTYRVRFQQPAADAESLKLHPKAGDIIVEYGNAVGNPVTGFTKVNDTSHPASSNPRYLVRSNRDSAIVMATFQRVSAASQLVEMQLNVVSGVKNPSMSGRNISIQFVDSVDSTGVVTLGVANLSRLVAIKTYANFNVACESLR